MVNIAQIKSQKDAERTLCLNFNPLSVKAFTMMHNTLIHNSENRETLDKSSQGNEAPVSVQENCETDKIL